MIARIPLFLACLLPSIASAGLLAHWKLDSSSTDETGDFPATWQGSASYTSTVAAPASSAAGGFSETWLNAGYGFNFERNQTFSASAWIKSGPQDSAIVGDMVQGEGSQGWELHVGTSENGAESRSITVWLIDDYPALAIQVSASINVLDGDWHQVGFSYDGSSTADGVKLYIDGGEVPCIRPLDTLGGSIANNSAAQLEIGTRMNGVDHQFIGAIDEVAIFNHTLTATEMAAIHQTGVESVSHPLVTDRVPLPGQSVTTLPFATVKFSFPVTGVDAADLRINGVAATGLEALDEKSYRFTFPTPPQGDVIFTWATEHAIIGRNGIPAQPEGWRALFVPELPPGQVVISEFLTKNSGGREDEDHDTPDWIELYNPGTSSVNLAGWALTDDRSVPQAWVFPTATLLPQARLLVFASGKNRRVSGGSLHTHFKLATDGGYLALSNPAGTVVHEFDGYPPQEANVSFGLATGALPSAGRAAWRYLTPTPAAVSSTQYYSAAAIRSLDFSPKSPQPGDAITILLNTSPEAVPTTAPTLAYKVMYGPEVNVDFFDDGQHNDGVANDGLWTAAIPAGATAGQMVRWRASLRVDSIASRWPVNQAANEPLPLYEGVVIGGGATSGTLPIYQIFVPGYVFPTTTNQTGIDSDNGARGAFFGNGKLYDNVLIRIKGTTSRYLLKRSHRVDFNPGRDFEWSAEFPAQRELNLNSEFNDPSYLRQNQQLWMHRDSGKSGAQHFPVKLLMNGETWQLAFHTYSADSELIEAMGLDPRGALYKQVGTLATGSGAEKKSRRWEDTSDFTLLKNGIASSATADAKSRYVFDNLNMPAVINYLAVTRLAQEADDVWANMVVYRDSEGTREWQPIPFDLNLSFGQLFYGGVADNTTVHGNHDTNKGHPLYGSSSCQPQLYAGNGWNRLYDAIIQNPVTRAMLLRRIRTLTDRYLTTTAATSPLDANFDSLGSLIRTEANTDRARWGLPPTTGSFVAYGLGPGISPAQGIATLKSDFLAQRRTHFYVTHSINNPNKTLGVGNNNKAGIPDEQVAAPAVTFGTIEAQPAGGNLARQYIQLRNSGSAAIDVSDWVLRGSGGLFRMKGGTVIAPNSELYVSPDVVAFRNRTVSPKANENRQVVGPYSGRLSAYGETLRLETAEGTLIAQAVVPPDPNAPPIHLAVTEILSSSAHTVKTVDGDWWELTNTGDASLNLAGFSWDDSSALAGQMVFPNRTLAAGESLLVLNEDDASKAAAFRAAWNLPATVQILTREDFGLADLTGLGNGDSAVVFAPDGTRVARADYPAHQAGRSRAWFRDGSAVPGGYSEAGKFTAIASNQTPADIGSPGSAVNAPAALTPYQTWAAIHGLTGTAAEPASDPDGDGRNNHEEYVFGGNPGSGDNPPAQTITSVPSFFEWTFPRRSDDPAVAFTLEASADLTHWEVIKPTLLSEVPHPSHPGFVLATYQVARAGSVKFLRVRGE